MNTQKTKEKIKVRVHFKPLADPERAKENMNKVFRKFIDRALQGELPKPDVRD